MRVILLVGAAGAIAVCLAAAGHDNPAKAKPSKPQSVTLSAADVKWGPAPAAFPPGAQLAVLHGDPSKKGSFALRFKMPDGYRIAAHWHTQDEELTILSGTFLLTMGDKEGEPHALDAGSYHFLPGKMRHSASAKRDVVLEVHGTGPFDIHYVNPADDPTKSTAASK
jgi:quercetin dioxygenase-like cupin family protein